MDVSVSITAYPSGGVAAALADLGQAADDLGLHTVWATDHLIQADPSAAITDPMLEAYAVLSFLAATTRRIRLGAMVSPVTYRPPALLIKTVTTIDVLSAGRAWLGLGAGYQETRRGTWACHCRRRGNDSNSCPIPYGWPRRCGGTTPPRSTGSTPGSSIP